VILRDKGRVGSNKEGKCVHLIVAPPVTAPRVKIIIGVVMYLSVSKVIWFVDELFTPHKDKRDKRNEYVVVNTVAIINISVIIKLQGPPALNSKIASFE